MKEMVGGCCVCSDERGWPDNPLVYCDGNGCNVAVHQACYGIVTVPTGPWFCRKCESTDRTTKVRCELCPSKAGALKKADTGGWAHVVCALYIPEVRFGNVTSMEPIILQLIPAERYNKICYICQELGKMSRSSIGACMQCNKSGCKQQFHVTCAQSLGLLCEEAGNYLDNVKYCGYCRHHYGKLKKGGNVKTIPPYKPISQDSHSSDSSPEKDGDMSPAAAAGSATSGSHTSSSALSSSSSKNVQSSKSSASSRKTSQVAAPSTSKSSSQSTSKGSTSAAQNYASGHESSATSGSGSSSKSQSKSSSKSSGSQAAKSSHQSEKSSGPKKAASPQESQRRNSTTEPASTSSTSTVTTSPVVQLSAIPLTTTDNTSTSSAQKPQGNTNQNTTKHASQQDTVVVHPPANTSATPNISGSNVPANQQGGQKFTNTNFIESVIMNSDSVFGIETKQTKKRKAVNQAVANAALSASAASSAAGDGNIHSNIQQQSGTQHWGEVIPSAGHPPDSTNEDKMRKNKIDASVIPKSTTHLTGGLNIQMEPNLSQVAHQAHYASTVSHTSAAGSAAASNIQQLQQQQNPCEGTAGSSSSTVSKMGLNSSAHAERHPAHQHQSHPHKYSLQPTQNAPADLSRPDVPTSLVVSVPLPQTSQGLNLSAHQMVDPGPSSSNSYSSRHAGTAIDMAMDQPLSQPSSSGWNLKIQYEPQTSHMASSSHAMDPSMDSVSNPKRARLDNADMRGGSGMSHDYAGTSKMALDMVDRMSNPHSSSGRSKKRSMPAPGPPQMHPVMPPGNMLIPGASPTNSMHQNSAIKRNPQPTPPPQTSTSTIVDQQIINDSPPLSPDSPRPPKPKPHLDRMGRAPHMLGNELNPESAAAARLSEQLNAELAAHAIFRAPSPLVAPPLNNRTTQITGRALMGMPAALGFAGGAQSLDQLLERQWEQGSQFLMEQAQHFDIASLLSCLHQLRSENIRLEEHVNSLLQRRDHLLAVNARLAIPLNAGANMTPEPVRTSRDTASNMRQQQNAMRHGHEGPVDRAQQLAIRDMQQRPS